MHSALEAEKKKVYTTTAGKKDRLENFSSLKEKLSRPVVGTKTLLKPGKPYLPPRSFLCGPHFFRQRKVPNWSRAVYAFFFPGKCWSPPRLCPKPTKFWRSRAMLPPSNAPTLLKQPLSLRSPPPGRGVKTLPGANRQKESPHESEGESLRVPAAPTKELKMSPRSQNR